MIILFDMINFIIEYITYINILTQAGGCHASTGGVPRHQYLDTDTLFSFGDIYAPIC